MTQEKKNSPIIWVAIAGLLVLLAGGMFIAGNNQDEQLSAIAEMAPDDMQAEPATEASLEEEPIEEVEAEVDAADGESYMPTLSPEEMTMQSSETSEETTVPVTSGVEPVTEINVEAALAERILGDDSAEIKISEHSSFTCGHCGNFHRGTFKALKAEYIDTGRAYMVFSDFPLNAPALMASMVTRCVAEENYFPFVQELFENQEDWAFQADFEDQLKERAAAYGLGEDMFAECIASDAIREGIIARMQAVQKQWEISSTPSFVVNNRIVLNGNLPLSAFEQAFNPSEATQEGGTVE